MVKLLKRKIEDGKVSVRNVRRDAVDTLRKMERDKAISQDEQRRSQETIQKATDSHTRAIDEIGGTKEAEILQV
jgi:ribosome recycling factor